MSRRLPAPPPGGPRPDAPDPDGPDSHAPDPDAPDLDEDDLFDDEADWHDDLDDALGDPDQWPDDEEPAEPAGALDEPHELDPADDDGLLHPVDDEPLADAPTFDEPEVEPDLAAPTDDLEARTIIDAVLVARWADDDREVQAVAEPASEHSVWELPEGEPGPIHARLWVAGELLHLELQRRPGPAERVRLGRDALTGRFLVRA